MKDTNNTTKLNPEIEQKIRELFKLLEDEIEKGKSEDTQAEELEEQLGDFIKNSKGFDQLLYAYRISLTASELAVKDLEESAYEMNDEAFETITDLADTVLRLAKELDKPNKERDQWYYHHFKMLMDQAHKAAKKVDKQTGSLWQVRARSYGRELKKLKAS